MILSQKIASLALCGGGLEFKIARYLAAINGEVDPECMGFAMLMMAFLAGKEIAKAGSLAKWIVIDSKLHPLTRDSPVMSNMVLGGQPDPTTKWQDTGFDEHILALQRGAYKRATVLVHSRRNVIEKVADELCSNPDESVSGERIMELLRTMPELLEDGAHEHLEDESIVSDTVLDDLINDNRLRGLAEVIMGKVSDWDLLPSDELKTKAQKTKEQLLDQAEQERLQSIARFCMSDSLETFPDIKPAAKDKGPGLEEWMPPPAQVINL